MHHTQIDYEQFKECKRLQNGIIRGEELAGELKEKKESLKKKISSLEINVDELTAKISEMYEAYDVERKAVVESYAKRVQDEMAKVRDNKKISDLIDEMTDNLTSLAIKERELDLAKDEAIPKVNDILKKMGDTVLCKSTDDVLTLDQMFTFTKSDRNKKVRVPNVGKAEFRDALALARELGLSPPGMNEADR